MDGKSSRNKVSIGASSLILIFIVLCMATFGLLSLSSAQGDLKLARRNAELVCVPAAEARRKCIKTLPHL